MNRASFMDELLKIASLPIEKRGEAETAGTVPEGLMSSDPVPDHIRVAPDEVETRLPKTHHLPSVINAGSLGEVTMAKDPIDQYKYNRVYRDRR